MVWPWFALSEATFDGRARSILWVYLLVAGILAGLTYALAGMHGKRTRRRWLQHAGIAVAAFALIAFAFWMAIAVATGRCPTESIGNAEGLMRLASCPEFA
jgi:hypothetical protein